LLHTSFERGDGTVAARPLALMTMEISGTEIVAGDVTKPGFHRL